MEKILPYQPKNKIRIVTAGSLFDGHDAAINIMRRILQSSGAEIIHLGHNRSVQEIVNTAIQEDVQGIALTSYQGGHNEFFKYMYDLLQEQGAGHVKIYGGGGGTILPTEIDMLHKHGITRIYSPDDGREMGLQGMINDMLEGCDFPVGINLNGEVKKFSEKDPHAIARMISAVENFPEENKEWLNQINKENETKTIPVLGITGTGGAGKSSLVDELVRRYLMDFEDKTIAIVSVDPSKRKTGGALLGDRIRMNAINQGRVYMRSLATRQSNLALSKHVQSAVDILKGANFDLIILETSGIGQSDTEIVDHSDVAMYVMSAFEMSLGRFQMKLHNSRKILGSLVKFNGKPPPVPIILSISPSTRIAASKATERDVLSKESPWRSKHAVHMGFCSSVRECLGK